MQTKSTHARDKLVQGEGFPAQFTRATVNTHASNEQANRIIQDFTNTKRTSYIMGLAFTPLLQSIKPI